MIPCRMGGTDIGQMHPGRIPNCSDVPNRWVDINMVIVEMATGLPC